MKSVSSFAVVTTLCLAISVSTTQAFVNPSPSSLLGDRRRRADESSSSPTSLHGFLNDLKGLPSLFQQPNKNPAKIEPSPKYDTVVIEPDFRVAIGFLALGVGLDCIPYIQYTLGPLVTLLGALFLFQTFRIRFIFDEQNAFELVTTSATNKDELLSSGENVIVGGANRWDCNTIVNYDFFPKGWIDGPIGQPILVYFKETQTPSESWNEGPGKAANDPEKIAAGTGK